MRMSTSERQERLADIERGIRYHEDKKHYEHCPACERDYNSLLRAREVLSSDERNKDAK